MASLRFSYYGLSLLVLLAVYFIIFCRVCLAHRDMGRGGRLDAYHRLLVEEGVLWRLGTVRGRCRGRF